MNNTIEIYCDGACYPNNPGGAMAYGFVVFKNGTRIHQDYGKCRPHENNTNNRAEYIAVGKALRWLIDNGHVTTNGHRSITVYSDSRLIVNQVNQAWQCHEASLRPYWRRAVELYNRAGCTLQWIPREQNHYADQLTRNVA